jgi:hypothetical protein
MHTLMMYVCMYVCMVCMRVFTFVVGEEDGDHLRSLHQEHHRVQQVGHELSSTYSH